MAVGMNIDIASIDMVSEVNMVSIKVYSCVSTDLLHLGTGRRKDPTRGGGGVHEYVYEVGCGTVFEISELAVSGP